MYNRATLTKSSKVKLSIRWFLSNSAELEKTVVGVVFKTGVHVLATIRDLTQGREIRHQV